MQVDRAELKAGCKGNFELVGHGELYSFRAKCDTIDDSLSDFRWYRIVTEQKGEREWYLCEPCAAKLGLVW
jgi:hypothetical protein